MSLSNWDRESVTPHSVHFQHRGTLVGMAVSDVLVDLLDSGRHSVAVGAHLPRLQAAVSYHVHAQVTQLVEPDVTLRAEVRRGIGRFEGPRR